MSNPPVDAIGLAAPGAPGPKPGITGSILHWASFGLVALTWVSGALLAAYILK